VLAPSQQVAAQPPLPGSVTVSAFQVDGNTLLTPSVVDAVLARFKGQRTLAELKEAAAALQEAGTRGATKPTIVSGRNIDFAACYRAGRAVNGGTSALIEEAMYHLMLIKRPMEAAAAKWRAKNPDKVEAALNEAYYRDRHCISPPSP
jgi:hypothetical protein